MKDSGIEWIGEIPQEWDVRRIKFTLDEHSGGSWGTNEGEGEIDCICVRVADFNYPKLSVDFHDKMTVRSYAKKAIEEGCIKSGDILLEKSGGGDITPVGRSVLFESNEQMMCANFIEWLRPNQCCNARFLNYWLAAAYANGFSKRNVKQTTGIQNLDVPAFLSERIAAPVVGVQEAIADFLDAKCAEIDALIAAKEKTNALLKERRQSIIYEAVTRGLNPEAPMKDSGIEWIGQIPETHQLVRLKYLCEIFGRIGFRGYTQADLVPEGEGPITLSPSNISENGMDYSKCTYLTWEKYYESPEIQIKNNDILLVKTGSSYGKSAIVENLPMEATINPQFVVMKKISCNPKFLYYVMQTQIFKCQVEQVVVGGTIPTMAQEKINNFYIVMPHGEEIHQIVDYLDKICAEMDTLISANEATIQKLKEYRQSIIYEAVTGKIEI